MPTVSVLMPVHNGMPYLPQAVDSILAQTFRDWELVVIDDGSADSTPGYLANLRDPRIRILRNVTNLGIARSLNRGIRESSGEYIARQDADDYSHPTRIEKQVLYLDAHRDVALLGTNFYIVANGIHHGPVQRVFADLDLRFALLFDNVIAHTSVLLRRSAAVAAGGYPEECRLEDYELWLRMAEFAPFACLREPLVQWMRRHDSYTNSDSQRSQHALVSASERYLARLLGGNLPRELFDDFLALYRGGGRPLPSSMSLKRVKAATAFATQLQSAFYARAGCDHWAAQRHCAPVRARWAGHLVRLALEGGRGLQWRAGLVANAFQLLVSPVMASAPARRAVGAAH